MGLSGRYFCMLVLVLAWMGRAQASEDLCFDFASPILDSLLQASRVQRLLIVVRNAEVDARWAAKGLSFVVRRRGIEVTIMRNSQALSPRDLAVEESQANQAQMVAIIEVLSGSDPKLATADFRDRTGVRLAMLSGVRAQSAQCRVADLASPPKGGEEERALGTPSDESEEESDIRDTPEDRPARQGPDRTWYGWQLMLADAASVGALLSPVPSLAVPTYLLAPPLIHAANGEGRSAWLSIGLRSGIPLAGIGLGFLSAHLGACSKASDSCQGSRVLGGLFVGMAIAAIVDDALLTWKETKDPDNATYAAALRRPGKDPGLSVGVGVLPYRAGAGLSLAGHF
jgi:hypothetical protein